MEESRLNTLSASISHSLSDAIDAKGFASLVVSGGSSPLPLYNMLSMTDIDWSKVFIYLGDDRVVESNHKDSNEHLIKTKLMINNASKASFNSLLYPELKVNEIKLPFDIVLLGLGMDGHFASLFPDQLTNLRMLDVNALPALVKSEQPLGSPCYQRISMNLSLLIDTKRCILIVPSADKRAVIEKAYGDKRLPLFFLLNQNKTTVEFSDLDFT